MSLFEKDLGLRGDECLNGSPPLSADASMVLSDIIIAQRFGVAQGLKADGTPKAACAFTQLPRGRNTHTRASTVR